MPIRPYRPSDAPALAALAVECARGEADFVLNPLWETPEDLEAEFTRFGIRPEEHVLVADEGDGGEVQGMVGFLRRPKDPSAGMLCPIVRRKDRGRGIGGELLRAAQRLGAGRLGIELATAGVGTRNRAGYSLLTSHGFRPVRQAYVMKCERAPAVPEEALAGLDVDVAKPEDAAAILELYLACGFESRSEERMREVLSDGRHVHAVARAAQVSRGPQGREAREHHRGGALAAFVELETHWPKRPWVAFLGVAKERRDRGVGSALMAWLLERQFSAGAKAALLALSPANRTALRAYEKVRFRRFRLIDALEKKL
ncbi:MAG TPA: GNAT family N-acetyltransferase [Myxococcota bacterium]|nr:GNAT family N-acetyltransferase [Myxococcota bacterium]